MRSLRNQIGCKSIVNASQPSESAVSPTTDQQTREHGKHQVGRGTITLKDGRFLVFQGNCVVNEAGLAMGLLDSGHWQADAGSTGSILQGTHREGYGGH